MKWNKKHINNHLEAAQILHKIMQESFEFISKGKDVSEYSVWIFVLKKFKEYGLKADAHMPIIAFDENSAYPHFFPSKKSKKLKPNTFILLDIWGRLEKKSSPYADITWVAYYGKSLPDKIKKVFEAAFSARDFTVKEIKNNLAKNIFPKGKDVHEKVNAFISKKGFGKYLLHGTGHSIGFRSPHGCHKGINKKGNAPLEKNLGYSIEPGIYIKGEFGIRSEIDFYIDEKRKMHITTTPVQKEIILIKPRG